MSAAPLTSDRVDVPKLTRASALAGAAGVAACVLLGLFDNKGFFRAWLVAFCFVLGPTLGSLVVIMLSYLVGGNWGFVIRRPLEAATRTMPLVTLLFVPIAFGIWNLYDWSLPSVLESDSAIRHKEPYLNPPFFLIRAAIYFAIWNLLIYLFNGWSRIQDVAKSPAIQDRCAELSAPGIVLYVVTITFASIDWVMSLEPHWYSTIFMAIFGMGQVLSGFVLAIAAMLLLSPPEPPLPGQPHPDGYIPSAETATTPPGRPLQIQTMSDLGSLMLAFIMVWAYLSFCQYLLIWSGNLPVEVGFYSFPANRVEGGWGVVGTALAVLHFGVPFFLLLPNTVKRNRYRLAALALWVLLMRLVDLFWVIVPSFGHGKLGSDGIPFLDGVLYLSAVVGLGGLWFAYYLYQIQRMPLLPHYDPEEVSRHGAAAHH